MAQQLEQYLAVLKASYDYTPQSEDDEIAIKEDQLLFLIDKVDDDWWKVKIKGDSQDDDTPVGLVPAAYVEPADHTSIVKALYDYDATANGELSVKEDEILHVFGSEDEWLLVQSQHTGGKAGYVPGNYVEAISEEEASAPSAAATSAPPTTRPVSTYVDPAERVALAKATTDDIKTWSVSEMDKKGKKKKGTLGIGNGAVFFASEADKAPVQQWKTTDINAATTEKSKHVHIDIGGPNPINLHFHAGSKDNAEAILAKLESSKEIHSAARSASPQAASPPPEESEASRSAFRSSGKKNGASVHFSPASPTIIPAREESDDEEQEEEEDHHPSAPNERTEAPSASPSDDGEWATALYDFTADGDDELTVKEGERLLVLEKDGNDWWKCRNTKDVEGVVPASYLEPESGSSPPVTSHEDEQAERAAREAREREEAARLEGERKERERKERERKERLEREEREERERAERDKAEQERKKAEAHERAKAAAEAAEQERRKRKEATAARTVSPPAEPRSSRSESKRVTSPPSTPTRPSTEKVNFPPAEKTRVWHDRTGQFRVEAAFLGFSNGKLRLHKINGVIVEVPAEKMSHDDLRYVEKLTKRSKSTGAPRISEDDIPLALQRPNGSSSGSSSSRHSEPQATKKPRIDWFDFFLSVGCDVDDCTKYAAAFDKDKIDEAILPDITESTMRNLGLREGDIIRVKKGIEKRGPHKTIGTPLDQLRSDEEMARRLQAEESGAPTKPPPNLFSTPNGALKPARRGRPQPSKSLPLNVDLNTIATVSDQITRTSSPQTLSPAVSQPSSSVQPPPRSSSALATKSSGFEDDAWTNRPSSTKPITPTPATAPARAPSAPPAQAALPTQTLLAPTPPPPPPAPAPAPTVTAPAAPLQTTSPSLAKTTESDIFDQLARLSELRKTQQPAASPSPPVVIQANPTIGTPNALMGASPIGSSPLGVTPMGTTPSPAPLGQPFQQPVVLMQPTPPPQGPRGPLAPVPANQSLLQPLIPTQTGFNSFIPTHATTNRSPFQQQPSFLNTQPTSFVNSQPTGFPGLQPVLSQPTGIPMGGFGQTQVSPFQSNGFGQNGFGQIQPATTGFNPSFGQVPVQQSPPPLPSNTANSTSPANIFAQMKSGTFAADNDSNPQLADRYNALRTNPIAVQPTGWGGIQGGYNGYHQ